MTSAPTVWDVTGEAILHEAEHGGDADAQRKRRDG